MSEQPPHVDLLAAITRMQQQQLAALSAMQQQIAALIAKVDGQSRPQRRLSAEDRALLERLLPLARMVWGEQAFLASDLLEEAPADNQKLLTDMSPRAIGKWLSRVEGCPVGGLQVRRSGMLVGAVAWTVVPGS